MASTPPSRPQVMARIAILTVHAARYEVTRLEVYMTTAVTSPYIDLDSTYLTHSIIAHVCNPMTEIFPLKALKLNWIWAMVGRMGMTS